MERMKKILIIEAGIAIAGLAGGAVESSTIHDYPPMEKTIVQQSDSYLDQVTSIKSELLEGDLAGAKVIFDPSQISENVAAYNQKKAQQKAFDDNKNHVAEGARIFGPLGVGFLAALALMRTATRGERKQTK